MEDHLFTSGMGKTHNSAFTTDGIPSSTLREGWDDPLINLLASKLLELIESLKAEGIFPDECFNLKEVHLNLFARRIHPANILEGLRIALTVGDQHCQPHIDQHNDPLVSGFVSVSKLFTGDGKTH